MECQSRSCHKHTLLQMWCGLLTVSMVIMAAFLASIKPKSEEKSVSTLKPDVVAQTVTPQKDFLKSDGTSYMELVTSLDGLPWQEHLKSEPCSILLRNNSIHSTTNSLYFIYTQVTFSKHQQTKSVILIRNAIHGKKAKKLVDVPAVAGGSVWVAKIVKLRKGDSVSLNITGAFQRENTFWGAFQLH